MWLGLEESSCFDVSFSPFQRAVPIVILERELSLFSPSAVSYCASMSDQLYSTIAHEFRLCQKAELATLRLVIRYVALGLVDTNREGYNFLPKTGGWCHSLRDFFLLMRLICDKPTLTARSYTLDLFRLKTTVKCSLQTFSEVLMDFSEVMLDFLPKKSIFAQKAIKDVFRGTDGFWDVFRGTVGIFRSRNQHFEQFRAHSFPSKRWKSQCLRICLFTHRFCRFCKTYASHDKT